MTKNKVKDLSDFIPLIILTISAYILLWTVATTEITFLWKHIVGLIILPFNLIAFWWRHKIGVLALGLTLIIGLFGLLSYSPSVTSTTFSVGKTDKNIPIFYGQPVFIFWLLIHFVLSARHYVGVLTKKYWQNLFKNLSAHPTA